MKRTASLLLLSLAAFGLYAVDLWGLNFSPLLLTAPWLLLLAALIDGAVISTALPRAAGSGYSLAGRLGLLIFTVKTAVIVVESIYLPDVISLSWVPGLLLNGLSTALLLALAATWLNRRWTGDPFRQPWFPWANLSWRRWLLTGLLWMLLFVISGLLIFQPIACALDEAVANAYLTAFTPENPLLILAFQFGRGLLWAILTWPFLNIIHGRTWQRGLLLGLLFAGFMSSAQLQGLYLLPDTIWPAHLAEIVVENFLFGMIVAWALHPLPNPSLASNKRNLAV